MYGVISSPNSQKIVPFLWQIFLKFSNRKFWKIVGLLIVHNKTHSRKNLIEY